MKTSILTTIIAVASFGCINHSFAADSARNGISQQNEIARWDSRMALEKAVVDTDGVKWIDGKFLPIEGRAFDNVDHWYDRLPSTVTTNVNGGVRSMKHHP